MDTPETDTATPPPPRNNDATADKDKDDKDKDKEKDKEKDGAKEEPIKVPKKRGRPPLSGNAAAAAAKKKVPKMLADDDDDEGAGSDEDHDLNDEEGNKKISKDGELLGGRVFKVRTFRLARHPTRFYVLTLDIARALGFRDSYLLHMKNPQIKRIYATDDDKQVLESIDLLASNFRSRPLGIMAIRTAYKYFGYQLLVRGKPVRDDYVCQGKVEPENWVYPEDEDERMSGGSDVEDRGIGDERYRKGGSSVKRPVESIGYYEPIYRAPPSLLSGLASVPSVTPSIPPSTAVDGTATDSTVPTSTANGTTQQPAQPNQQDPRSIQSIIRSAASAAEFNSRLRAQRRRGRYLDIHTNVEQVPQLSQPTHVLVEKQLGSKEKGMVLEVSFGDIRAKPASSEVEDWMAVGSKEMDQEGVTFGEGYPVALMLGQYQAGYSVHRTRFEQSVAPIKSNESFFVDYTGKPLLAADGPVAVGAVPVGAGPGGIPAAAQQPLQPQAQQPQRPAAPTPGFQPPQARPMPVRPAPPGAAAATGTPVAGVTGSNEHFNQPGFVPAGMTQEQWAILKPKLTYSQLKELREQAPVVSMGPSGKYSVRFTCGYLTRSGNYCQKPVMEAGVICLFHQKMRAQELAAAQGLPPPENQSMQQYAISPAQLMPMMPMVGSAMPFHMQNQPGMMTPQPMMYNPMMPAGTARPILPSSAPAKISGASKPKASSGTPAGGGSGVNKKKAANLADPDCAICRSAEPPEEEFDDAPAPVLLRCAECGLGHHLGCAEVTAPVMVAKCLAPGSKWKCGNCKMCEVCNKAGEDETLMVLCDACDKGYHTYCMVPKMDKAPSGSWHCPSCRVCLSCGTTDVNMDWRHVSVPPTHEDAAVTGKIEIYACTYCVSCHKRFEGEQFCPLCFHVYNEEMEDIAMACCDVCDRWIHVGCDPDLTESRYKKLDSMNAKYTCVLCSDAGKLQVLMARTDKANRMTQKPSKLMMYHGKYLVVPPLAKRAPEKSLEGGV
ncbi:PHD finger protein 10 [Rhizoclosmatium sp. JEL0117]|nr:PHD finger protein 10 [Rhizoclosmatium sp. JEL0117]